MSDKKLIKCKKCGAEIAEDAKSCPKCGSESHRLREKVTTAIVGTVIAIGVAVKLFGGDDQPKASPQQPAANAGVKAPTTSPTPAATAKLASLPWLAEVDRQCQAVAAGVNDIQKNKLFSTFTQSLRAAKIVDVTGTLKSMEATPGGGDVELEVEVPVSSTRKIVFLNSLLDYSITRGSRVFKAIENLPVGACVVFAADRVKPVVVQGDSVKALTTSCTTERFGVRFTQVRPCDGGAGGARP